MKHVVDMSWTDKLAFTAEIDGHNLILDADIDTGGSDLGMRPKKLMLASLAGCTGIDVVSILNKMKVFPDSFNVIVEGDVSEEHPKRYTSMKVIYRFKGKDLPIDKIQKAITLSQTKYCGVSAFYQQVLDVKTEIEILP
jgi:putative redox protein